MKRSIRAVVYHPRRCFSSYSTMFSPLIGLNSRERTLYQEAEEFAVKHLKPQAVDRDEYSIFSRELFKELGKQGYGGMLVSKDQGGMGLNRREALCVIEALSKYCVSTTAMVTIHNACTHIISRHATQGLRDQWVLDLCKFEKMASFGLTEPGSGSDAASISTTVYLEEGEKGEYVLKGQKCFTSGGGESDIYIMMCKHIAHPSSSSSSSSSSPSSSSSSPYITAVLVPHPSANLSFGSKENKMGWRGGQVTRSVFLDNVRVPATNLLGKEGGGFRIAMGGLDGARLSVAACSLGGAQRVLEMVLEMIKLAGSVEQMHMFRLAEMQGQLLECRVMLREAARMLDERADGYVTFCALAKLHATEKCSEVVAQGMQLLDYHSLLKANELERVSRDLRVHQILEGSSEIMRLIVGRGVVA